VIAQVRGRLLRKEPQEAIVDVGGVGYRVVIPLSTFYRIGEPGDEVTLLTHTHVREDALALFGFLTAAEQALFERLIAVSGVGPKLALALLSGMAPDSLRLAIGQDQPDVLARIPGIGKKTAQKIVLDLKDKVGPVEVAEGLAALTEADAAVIDALTALGYSIVEAQRAVQGLPRDVTDVEDRLRRALASFGG